MNLIWIFTFFTVKNSYLIFVLFFAKYFTIFYTFLLKKNTKINLKIGPKKIGPKVVIENFIGTKSGRKILERLKGKVGIFIETKNIFNLLIYKFSHL